MRPPAVVEQMNPRQDTQDHPAMPGSVAAIAPRVSMEVGMTRLFTSSSTVLSATAKAASVSACFAFPMEALIVLASSHISVPLHLDCFQSQRWRPVHSRSTLVGSIQRLLFGFGNDEGYGIADMRTRLIARAGRAGLTQVLSMLLTSAPQGTSPMLLHADPLRYRRRGCRAVRSPNPYRSRRCARIRGERTRNAHRFIVQTHILDISACAAGETPILDSGNDWPMPNFSMKAAFCWLAVIAKRRI